MKKTNLGVTLFEIMLVLVIMGFVTLIFSRYVQQNTINTNIENTAVKMDKILHAANTYYLTFSEWPTNKIVAFDPNLPADSQPAKLFFYNLGGGIIDATAMQPIYLPYGPIKNSWGGDYFLTSAVNNENTSGPVFSVYTLLEMEGAGAIGIAISGKIPLSYTSTQNPSPPFAAPAPGFPCVGTENRCYVVAQTNIPLQTTQTIGAVVYSGLYHHGGCVPVPQCPLSAAGTEMTPTIMVVPTDVKGVNNPNNPSQTFPITSFSAYATTDNIDNNPPLTNAPYSCESVVAGAPVAQACEAIPGFTLGTRRGYWRVCLKLITTQGDVGGSNSDFGQQVSLLAVTRCAIPGEPGVVSETP